MYNIQSTAMLSSLSLDMVIRKGNMWGVDHVCTAAIMPWVRTVLVPVRYMSLASVAVTVSLAVTLAVHNIITISDSL